MTLLRDGDCEQLHCHLEPVGSGKLRNIPGMVNPEGASVFRVCWSEGG
jgi:hypothetical protein